LEAENSTAVVRVVMVPLLGLTSKPPPKGALLVVRIKVLKPASEEVDTLALNLNLYTVFSAKEAALNVRSLVVILVALPGSTNEAKLMAVVAGTVSTSQLKIVAESVAFPNRTRLVTGSNLPELLADVSLVIKTSGTAPATTRVL
jgi:hypothetical protein